MAKFVRIEAELFTGIAYWARIEYYEAGPGHVHVIDDYRDYAEYIAPGAETSLQGVFMRESGEWGEIWMPCPDNVEFVAKGAMLASLRSHAEGWDAYLQPTLSFFFDNTGSVFPLAMEDISSALSHKIPIGSYVTFEAAKDAVGVHARPYDGEKRRVPYIW